MHKIGRSDILWLIQATGCKKVLISPHWIDNVIWEDAVVCTTLNKDGVKNCPEYDPSFPLTPDYEEKLYQHYGRSLSEEREKVLALKQ